MYVKASNGQVEKYPYSIGLLRKENPNTSFPKKLSDEALASWGVYPVTEAADPAYNPDTQRVVTATTPVHVSGAWILSKTVEPLSQEEQEAKAKALMDSYSAAVQNLLDSTAKEKGYDNIISMTSYANSGNAKWANEATAAITWRDACWNESLVQMGNYLATGNKPSMEDFLAAMPTPVWPE